MDNQLKRIMNLVRKTGDRFIVSEPDGSNAYVVMDLNQYEAMVDLEAGVFDQADEPLDLPDEFFVPDSGQPMPPPAPLASHAPPAPQDHPEIWDVMPPAGQPAETWDLEKMDTQEKQVLKQQYDALQNTPVPASENKSISAETSQNIPAVKPDKDDFGEEQFYLEPIE
jgi:hypothetical protein